MYVFTFKRNPELINAAIEYIAKDREEINSKLIYPHDIFFRKVTFFSYLFPRLNEPLGTRLTLF